MDGGDGGVRGSALGSLLSLPLARGLSSEDSVSQTSNTRVGLDV